MLNEKEMKALAAQTFKDHPTAGSVIVFPDGNCFLGTSVSFAKLHARDSKLEGLTVTKAEVDEPAGAKLTKTDSSDGGKLSAQNAATKPIAGNSAAKKGKVKGNEAKTEKPASEPRKTETVNEKPETRAEDTIPNTPLD